LSTNPFTADADIRDRIAFLDSSIGAAVREAVSAELQRTRRDLDNNLGGVLPAAVAGEICAEQGITSDELMLLARPLAEPFAHPPISHYHVGAVGREAETGNLIFGGNLEFPGAHIWNTVHGEGFLATRAFSRGARLEAIALGEAHPCAHCRQYLGEFAGAPNLLLIDRLGHRLPLQSLYPWPFDPGYLGETGAVSSVVSWPDLTLLPSPVAELLMAAVHRAHAPYSKSPAAIVLRLKDGRHVTGAVIESVAFNPTMSPLQAALIDLYAHGYSNTDIAAADLGTTQDGAVDYVTGTVALLAAVAPDVPLTTHRWR
jgi:cytidine deaminase